MLVSVTATFSGVCPVCGVMVNPAVGDFGVAVADGTGVTVGLPVGVADGVGVGVITDDPPQASCANDSRSE